MKEIIKLAAFIRGLQVNNFDNEKIIIILNLTDTYTKNLDAQVARYDPKKMKDILKAFCEALL